MLTKADGYRQRAEAARLKKDESRDQYSKAAYGALARDWLRLAAQAEWIASLPPQQTKRLHPDLEDSMGSTNGKVDQLPGSVASGPVRSNVPPSLAGAR